MMVVLSPISVTDTKIISAYNFVALLIINVMHIQLATHYLTSSQKKLYGNRSRSNDLQKINKKDLKAKAKYKAKAM